MIIFKESTSLAKYLATQKIKATILGFVPTMGALHDGHLSLIMLSKKETDITVCSIFINPTQFSNSEDFKKYPMTLGADIIQLEKAGCDVLFVPAVTEIYPNGFYNPGTYNLGEIEFLLEGAHRPGHFQGVCQVVEQLLRIVEPDTLFLGQKDFQQTLVIKKMITLRAINVHMVIGPTERLTSGLAMSSRNMRLTNDGIKKAAAIYEMLIYIKQQITLQPITKLENHATRYLLNNGFGSVDYVSVVSIADLKPVSTLKQCRQLLLVIAATICGVRLIDNMMLD